MVGERRRINQDLSEHSRGIKVQLEQIDAATRELAQTLITAYASEAWERIRYVSRWTPVGDVGSDDFWLCQDGKEAKRSPSDMSRYLAVSRAAKRHWEITQSVGQPRWYKMGMTISSSGRFSVDFEYKDDYKEGDIMRGD